MAKLAIVGAGSVGSTLGARLLAKNNQVTYGARDPSGDKVKAVLAAQPGAKAASVADAVAEASVVILATPGFRTREQAAATARSLGPGIRGKVLLDATNPCSPLPGLEMLWGVNTSGGELLQAELPDTAVFKAFNTIGVEKLGHPVINGKPVTMMIAGPPDAEQLALAKQVVADVGFVPRYVGPIRYARNLEAMAELWIHLGVAPAGFTQENWGRDFAFQVVVEGEGA